MSCFVWQDPEQLKVRMRLSPAKNWLAASLSGYDAANASPPGLVTAGARPGWCPVMHSLFSDGIRGSYHFTKFQWQKAYRFNILSLNQNSLRSCPGPPASKFQSKSVNDRFAFPNYLQSRNSLSPTRPPCLFFTELRFYDHL